MSASDEWGSDAPVSRPVPIPDQVQTQYVDLGGMIFGPMGLMLPATEALIETRYTPTWHPTPVVRARHTEEGVTDG